MRPILPTVLVISLATGLFVLSRIGGSGTSAAEANGSAAATAPAAPYRIETGADAHTMSTPTGLSVARETVPPTSAPHAVDGRSAPGLGTGSREEAWARKYAGSTPAQLMEQRAAIEAAIVESSRDFFEAMFASGQYETVTSGNVWRGEGWDPEVIQNVQISGEAKGEIRRAMLPRGLHPELYELKAESVWIEKSLKARASHLAAQGRPVPR